MDKFFLKTWISRRVSYFVGILIGVEKIFLLGCPQVFLFFYFYFYFFYFFSVRRKI